MRAIPLAIIVGVGAVAACGAFRPPNPADEATQARRDYDNCLASHPENISSCEDQRVALEVAIKHMPASQPGLISAGRPADSGAASDAPAP